MFHVGHCLNFLNSSALQLSASRERIHLMVLRPVKHVHLARISQHLDPRIAFLAQKTHQR